MSKIIAVHGATGMQGGSVVKSLLKSEWKVRAITRNISSDSAKALAAEGVEVVAANFDDEASLAKAYEVLMPLSRLKQIVILIIYRELRPYS
jgi:uncharacterized protein YbjT (DUF2867 family)